jgi:hypothetical protein
MATIAAPNSVNYADQFPLGIQATSHRRLFFPSTGDKYSPGGSNIIRIDINYDGLLDTAQSYLMFKFKNTSTKKMKLDLGQPVISRLRVESGGVVLEDIQDYNQLLGGILVPSQSGFGNFHHESFNTNLGTGKVTTASNDNQLAACGYLQRNTSADTEQNANNFTGVIGPGDEFTMCYKLVSGLLDNDKYLPLVLMNAGLTISLELSPGNAVGVSEHGDPVDIDYEVSAVRYVAHLIDLQRDFYTAMRGAQQQAGGNLTIAGTSFRSYTATVGTGLENTLNIPARVRSIKSVFWKISTADSNQQYNLSTGNHANISSYQLKISATNYPPTAVNVNAVTNKIEPYLELQKAFGKLGSTVHSDLLGAGSYLILEDIDIDWADTRALSFAPFGIDLESFRHEIENGVDTSTRSLPMTLTLTGSGATKKLTVDVFVMYDALFYVDMNGAVNVSS